MEELYKGGCGHSAHTIEATGENLLYTGGVFVAFGFALIIIALLK